MTRGLQSVGQGIAHRLDEEDLVVATEPAHQQRQVRRLANDLRQMRAQLRENLPVAAAVENVEKDDKLLGVADVGAFAVQSNRIASESDGGHLKSHEQKRGEMSKGEKIMRRPSPAAPAAPARFGAIGPL